MKTYWRETVVVIMFLILQSTINETKEISENAYDTAADAAHYAYNASSYAEEASEYASSAADSASYCEYLN